MTKSLSFEKKLIVAFILLATGIVILRVVNYYEEQKHRVYLETVFSKHNRLLHLEQQWSATTDLSLRRKIKEQQSAEIKSIAALNENNQQAKHDFSFTYWILALCGTLILLDAFLMIRNHFVYRRKAEEKIKRLADELESRHHLVLDNMKEGIQIIGFDWRYQYLNKSVVKQSGNPMNKMIGRTMMEVYPGIEHTALFNALKKSMTERVALQMENEFEYPDGSKKYFDLSIQPVPEGLCIMSMDITGRKKREREQKAILFKISHEVRRPAANLTGLVEILAEPNAETEGAFARTALKQSVSELDNYLRQLSDFVNALKE